jgi:TATA-box binding protein (TBP) (component of TFIID and TFIIIB)
MNNINISTITAVSKINSNIDLKEFFLNCPINDIIKFIQFKEKVKGKKKKEVKKRNNNNNTFFNQITLEINIYPITNNKIDDKIINMKVFNNGKLQMTGLKYEDQGKIVITNIFNNIFYPLNIDNNIFKENSVDMVSYDIAMINSGFDVGFKIDRDILNKKIVIDEGYYSTYEPCMYPGVNTKYFINNNGNNGICKCNRICNGKGSGNGDGDCKKITIATFQSGQSIITGGKNREQINIAYKFINNIIDKYKDDIIFKENS